jgi:hypothetical protein
MRKRIIHKLINIVGKEYQAICGLKYNHIKRDILSLTVDEMITCKKCLTKMKNKRVK